MVDEPQAAPPVVSPTLARVLESAARLQQLVPDAVLVCGSAAAHRDPLDHDQVLADLQNRFRPGPGRRRVRPRVGTSPSRLSTYATGRVTPSASLLLRIEALAGATVAQPAGAAGAAGAVGAPDQQRP